MPSLGHIPSLFAYTHGTIKKKNGVLYRINVMKEHIHILSDLHSCIALVDYHREIKTTSSIWFKESGNFPLFEGWAVGNAALTCWWRDKEKVISYIRNQHEQHQRYMLEEEIR